MIDFELPPALKMIKDFAHGVARDTFRPIARKYDEEEHTTAEEIAFMLADMATETDGMRFLAWKAAWIADRKEDCTREAYLAKHYAGEYAAKITDDGVQVLGGHGYIREHPVELWFRNGRGIEIIDGLTVV